VKSNNVSIILYFRNQRELAEQTLTAIYENITGPYEVCVVDDASTDGTSDALRSVIEYYAHEETYFFEHSVSQGRALSIQGIIPQCSSTVIWMPVGLTTLHDEALRVALQQLRSSDVQFAVSGSFDWPETAESRKDIARNNFRLDFSKLPDDNQILIKLRGMAPDQCFVNPYLTGWFALEWLFRLQWNPNSTGSQPAFIEVSSFIHAIDDRRPDVARKAIDEFAALLHRYGADVGMVPARYVDERSDFDMAPIGITSKVTPDVDTDEEESAADEEQSIADISRYTAAFIEYIDDEDDSGVVPNSLAPASDKKEDVVANSTQPIQLPQTPAPSSARPVKSAKTHVMSPFGKRNGHTVDAGDSEVAAALKPRLEELFSEGEFPVALKEISTLIEANPNDVDLVRIKIMILERMRRYVEAAELKHKLKNGLTEFKVRKEKILVVDPADDTSSRAAVMDEQGERFPSRPVSVQTASDVPASSADSDQVSLSAMVETSVEVDEPFNEASTPVDEPADEIPAEEPKSNDKVDVFDGATSAGHTDEKSTFPAKSVKVADPSKTRISVVIPTTGDGKRLLESALVALSRHGMLPDRELIVIDNASLDETYRYLNQLRKDRFMNIRVITNPENKGFATAINQALEIARGEYVFVMHNDVHVNGDAPGLLADLMDIFDDIDVIAPVSGVSFNPDQRMHQPESDPESLRYSDYVDSFAMLIRRANGLRFDERFETVYFEDVDFCQQVRNRGKRVAIARGIGVDHLGGATAAVLGIEPNGQQYWKNLAQFNEKWDASPKLPYFGEEASPIFQLITISETINPFYPEKEMVQLAQRLLTSETRHEMVQTSHARNDLYALIRLMMVLDMRDVLRQLEKQLDDHDLDDQLRYELIDFYYRKHIYSRGEKYLNELTESRRHFEFRLLQLRILMGDKKLEEAAELLNMLIDERPAHPELFKITADLHKLSGNREEAAKFYLLAHQANPFVYSPRRDLLVG